SDLLLDLIGTAGAKSGVAVTWETALQAASAIACARVIAEGIAQVPLKLYRRRTDGGADAATDHPLYSVLHSSPAPGITSFEWRETMGLHLAMQNRAYCLINRSAPFRGQSKIELQPITPQQVVATRQRDWSITYDVTFDSGETRTYRSDQILHFRGPSWTSIEGLDGIRLAREAIGLALATEEHGARQFSNGAILGGILSTDAVLSAEQSALLKSSWESAQTGMKNAYRTAVLWGGLKWTPRAQQNDQAQWIEVRRFQVAEVCRFFRVLPIMIGEAANTATYASSEQMFLAHVVHTMGPWFARIEQRLDLQLLTDAERADGYFCKFSVAGLLRGSHKDRSEFYRTLYGIGALAPNEIRAYEDLNPYNGGEQYRVPLNMTDPSDSNADQLHQEGMQ
ncbi:MAG: phage portal protein, partial [Sterolibacterium sp.]|nr:phage portal protein [Sterolibacterium sp.]